MEHIRVTVFEHVSARFAVESDLTIGELFELIRRTEASSKDQLPLLKLAAFGRLATAKGSLRHDPNVLWCSGCEGDYDGGKVSFDDAGRMLHSAGVSGIIYTTPSHTIEKPHWRVLCPFSERIKPERRAQMVARLNGVLGGILQPESFTLSQAYYFGHVSSTPPSKIGMLQ